MPSPKLLKRCSSSISNESAYILSIQELRSRILQDKNCQKFNPSDIRRVEKEDWWLTTFVAGSNYDIDVAFSVLIECLRWRTNFEVDSISLLSIKPLLDRQLMYIHGTDLGTNPLLWINLAAHRPEDVGGFEKLFIFWVEQHFIQTNAAELVLLFDMTGTKLKHMDLNLFKFILQASKYYYPGIIKDLLVLQSPPILNGLWKVVRSWTTTGHPKIQHLDEDTIQDYIDPSNLPTRLGGTDNFQFTMNEIARCLPTPTTNENDKDVDIDYANSKSNLDNFPMRRSVKFDDPDEDAGRKTPLILTRRGSKGPGRRVPLPPSVKPVAEKRLGATESEWLRNAFVSISPRDELVLLKVDGENDFVDVVAVKNNSTKGVMYKIKTTSPEKFRVRPSTGLIAPGETEAVRVYLQNEYRFSCSKEKFLLMAVETANTQLDKFPDIWKAAEAEHKVEHKVRCKVADDADSTTSRPERKSSLIATQQEAIDALREQCRQTIQTQRLVIVVIGFLFAIQFIAMLYERSNYHALRMTIETLSTSISKSNQPNTVPNQPTESTPYHEEDL